VLSKISKMERTKFAQLVYRSQDERNESVASHGDLLISEIILSSQNSSDFIRDMYYWMDEIEKAIYVAEELEEQKGKGFNLKD